LGPWLAVAAALATTLILGAAQASPSDPTPGEFAAWQAAHPAVEAEVSALKAATVRLIAAAPPPPPKPRQADYSALNRQSAGLTPDQKKQAAGLFEQAFGLWQARDFAGAKALLIRQLAIDPASGAGNYYLGDILVREGRPADAAVAMDRARTLAPTSAEGLKAAAALPALPALTPEEPGLDRPPLIWRVKGAIAELWDAPYAPPMTIIPAGEYTMGSPATEPGRDPSEGPRHRVRIAYAFAVSRYPVTVAQYARFIDETHYDAGNQCQTFVNGKFNFVIGCNWKTPNFPQGPDNPVIALNWHDARAYADWLSRKTGRRYRLLSEAEYEYVARAGAATAFWWGDDPAAACAKANAADLDAKAYPGFDYWTVNACHDGHVFTASVAAFGPNPFGLYGVSGNSLSWLADCWTESYVGAPNDGSPVFDEDCQKPAIRGGSWADKPSFLRSATRGWNLHNIRFTTNGFRVARDL
jgi:formylglycine-generating enzyme required for sulfatase activity